MIELAPSQVTPELRALFRRQKHTFRRGFAVLDGVSGGRILSDDPTSPNWGAVHELSSDGSLFLGGALDGDLVARIIQFLRRERMLTVGLMPNDPLAVLLPPNASAEGVDFDFEDRESAVALEPRSQAPPGLELARIDSELLPRCGWRPWMSVSNESALKTGLGYCLLDGDRVVAEAFAGPIVAGTLEMATITHEAYRRRGLTTIVSARTILECERLGHQTWWNTSLNNVASARIARSLGYRTEQRYATRSWSRSTAPHDLLSKRISTTLH